uniref:Uncharacterized protein n=1 Tax=Knipowitschia caucasica TaxID=637954 RepID=A0AAV2LHI9_KNICA
MPRVTPVGAHIVYTVWSDRFLAPGPRSSQRPQQQPPPGAQRSPTHSAPRRKQGEDKHTEWLAAASIMNKPRVVTALRYAKIIPLCQHERCDFTVRLSVPSPDYKVMDNSPKVTVSPPSPAEDVLSGFKVKLSIDQRWSHMHGGHMHGAGGCVGVPVPPLGLQAAQYERPSASGPVRAAQYERPSTSGPVRAAQYERPSTSGPVRAAQYERPSTSGPVQAAQYERPSTSGPVRAAQYKRPSTSGPVQAAQYERPSTSGPVRAAQYKRPRPAQQQ